MKNLISILVLLVALQGIAQANNNNTLVVEGKKYQVGDTLVFQTYTGLDSYQHAWYQIGNGLTRAYANAAGKRYVPKDYQGTKFLVKKVRKKQQQLILYNPSVPFKVIIAIDKAVNTSEVKRL